jgi:hypothetical protein
MAPNAIVEKLRTLLSGGPVETECQAVYLLCEVRKLLDKNPPDPTSFALRLYCHWALHINLSRPGTTSDFLTRVDDFVLHVLGSKERDETEWEKRAQEMILDFMNLNTFRDGLLHFLASHNLPTALCDDNILWYKFLTVYGGVIDEGSLTCVASRPKPSLGVPKGKLKMVEKVTFLKGPPTDDAAAMPFRMKWEILLTDGARLVIDGSTFAKHKGRSQTMRYIKPK